MLMYIGGMQMTPGPTYAPSRTDEPPGTMRTPLPTSKRLQRQRVLVEERPAAVIDRHVDEVAEAEPEQDALLHPGVDAPAGRATPDRAPRRARARRTARRAAREHLARSSRRRRRRRRARRVRSRASVGRGPSSSMRSRDRLRSASRLSVSPRSRSTRSIFARRLGARRHHRQPVRALEQPHRRHRGLDRDRDSTRRS